MKPTLVPGLTHTHRFTVTEEKTVGNLYPESPAFVDMPKVFATGFMVGFIEWACLEALALHLDDGEGSLVRRGGEEVGVLPRPAARGAHGSGQLACH